MKENVPVVVPVSSINDYFGRMLNLSRRAWIFRGHAKEDWHLESSLWRYLKRHKEKIEPRWWYAREENVLKRFQKSAGLYLNHLPDDGAVVDWLAIMQHYGSPTRLLDFTFNPMAALFFAVREAEDDSSFCVHALHLETIRRFTRFCRDNTDLNPPEQSYGIGKEAGKSDFVGVCDAHRASPRQDAQDGLFLVPSKIDFSFEDWLRDLDSAEIHEYPQEKHWIKFVFPPTLYYETVEATMQVGASPLRFFPGLEGLGETSKYRWLLDPVRDLDPV